MDNKIEITYEGGRFVWRVLTASGTLLCDGTASSRLDAAAAAIEWMER
jgi:hypothetical protein